VCVCGVCVWCVCVVCVCDVCVCVCVCALCESRNKLYCAVRAESLYAIEDNVSSDIIRPSISWYQELV